MYIEGVVSFIRKAQNEELLVLHNVSDIETTVELKDNNARFRCMVSIQPVERSRQTWAGYRFPPLQQ